MCKYMNTHSYNTNIYVDMYISCLVSPSLIVGCQAHPPLASPQSSLAGRGPSWNHSVGRVVYLPIYIYHMNNILYYNYIVLYYLILYYIIIFILYYIILYYIILYYINYIILYLLYLMILYIMILYIHA